MLIALLLALSGSLAAWSEIRVERSPDGRIKLVAHGRAAGTGATPRLRQPRADIGDLIDQYSARQSLDPRLVRAVIQAESDFDPRARSHKGAIGLMQLMPETARELGVDDPWDPEQNISGGTGYLRQMLDRFGGDLDLALAGYNAGPGAVSRHGAVPPYAETQAYVHRVLALYRGGSRVRQAVPAPARVEEKSHFRPFEVSRNQNGTIAFVTRK